VSVLQGGINSTVYLCRAKKRNYVLKGYKENSLNRFTAELSFLNFARKVAKNYVPDVYEYDDDLRCLVLEFIEGGGFTEGQIPSLRDLEGAIDFFACLNSDRLSAQVDIQMPAREGFLSLNEHLENVQQRLDAMTTENLPSGLKPSATELLLAIRELMIEVKETTEKKISTEGLKNRLTASDLVVSPSDFGFHNAIRSPKGIKFIDFEFAGWDDPAKAIVDFQLQPRIPIKRKNFVLLSALRKAEIMQIRRRCRILYPILLLKWTCIILAILNPKWSKIFLKTQSPSELEILTSHRLKLAHTYLQKELLFCHTSI